LDDDLKTYLLKGRLWVEENVLHVLGKFVRIESFLAKPSQVFALGPLVPQEVCEKEFHVEASTIVGMDHDCFPGGVAFVYPGSARSYAAGREIKRLDSVRLYAVKFSGTQFFSGWMPGRWG
jgi:hypothetical protein